MEKGTTLSVLPDDCLRIILVRLPIVERVKLRKVCKRFRDLCDDCWTETRNLRVAGCSYGASIIKGDSRKICVITPRESVAATVMQFCAPYLEEFSFFWSYGVPLLHFLKRSSRIKKLYINLRTRGYDVQFSKLLKQNQQLNCLEILMHKDQTCLKHLATNYLEKLEISIMSENVTKKVDDQFRQILQNVIDNSHSLKILDIAGTSGRDFPDISKCNSLMHLRILRSSCENCYFTSAVLMNITNLSNLREIFIAIRSESAINDQFLMNLSDNCEKLEKILLGPCYEVTDSGLKALTLLPRLKELHMGKVLKVTNKYLPYFTALEMLDIRDTKMTNAGIIKLLRNCQSLIYAYFGGDNFKIENLTHPLSKILKKRSNSAELYLYINSELIIDRGVLKQ